jgi:hypothetical protein
MTVLSHFVKARGRRPPPPGDEMKRFPGWLMSS